VHFRPSGISGVFSRKAFKYSEGNWSHWLLLILADRVNILEGVFDNVIKVMFQIFSKHVEDTNGNIIERD